MRYSPYFVVLFSISLIIGVLFAIINNDIIIIPPYKAHKLIEKNIKYNNNEEIKFIKIENNDKEKNQIEEKEEEEFWKKINEKEKELKKKEEEKKQKLEEKKKIKEKLQEIKEEKIKRMQNTEKKEKDKENDLESDIKNLDENIINKVDYELENKKINKLKITCAYSTDNSYLYPTLVSMTSLVANAGENTFYEIYIIINNEFDEENKIVLKSVEEKHSQSCEIIFININDILNNEKLLIPAYYKLELHNLLPNINKIIWLSGDTLILYDLSELFNLNMRGNYIMGFLDSLPDALLDFNIKDAIVINTGVLLMDLNALRKNNMTEKYNKFILKENEKIKQYDQTVINVVCQKYIAPLPPKYGM